MLARMHARTDNTLNSFFIEINKNKMHARITEQKHVIVTVLGLGSWYKTIIHCR